MHSDWFKLPAVRFAGMSICTASRSQLAEAAVSDAMVHRSNGRGAPPRLIFDANGHGVSLYQSCASYRHDVDLADVIHADGGFIVTASRWFASRRILERSATTDMIHDIAKRAEKAGASFYLLGATEEVSAKCAEVLVSLYPNLIIAGRRNGYFSLEEELSVVEDINRSGADILWVGLGKPLEQRFCVRNKARLKTSWAITCGGCYNYITGDYSRAPLWMQRTNIEWLHRLATNPRKLFLRYLLTTPHAIWIVAKEAVRTRKVSV
jgi:N-acetylglucosaminyldiphosphoundecaprenol N-acetyl-beta-D-mannosaminyltransferase